MDPKDLQGKSIHYSTEWERVTFASGRFKPGKSFRIYTSAIKTMVIKGVKMNRSQAVAVTLTEGYHNFVCDEIIESGSDTPDGVFALY
jgi:hypothetical protein